MIITAIAVFVVTNIDDLIVLIALYGSRQVGRRQIIVGQSLGISALAAVSVIAALGLVVVPDRWIGLFGVIPLGLGVRGLLHRNPE
jgi:cadmium resistance protein CadD (predicted permease)